MKTPRTYPLDVFPQAALTALALVFSAASAGLHAATFAGLIQDGNGQVALTKIGGGAQTLAGANTYSGATTVIGGTLALGESGSIASSQPILVDDAALDVSAVSGFSTAGPLSVDNGALIVRATGAPGINALNLTNSRVRVTTFVGAPSIETAALTTGGPTNLIDIISVGTITSYPTQFTVIKYSGTIGGAGFNFGLGDVPSPSTDGFISNNTLNASVDLVLLDGPKPLNWTGLNGSAWDIGTTTNWLAFGTTPATFLNADSVFFYDTAAAHAVDLTTTLLPAAIVVSNTAANYTFTGSGSLSGYAGLLKEGAGSLTLANAGLSDFRGGVTVTGGTLVFATDNSAAGGLSIAAGSTVQVGTNGSSGSLPTGGLSNEGALIFNRTGELAAPNSISGSGTLTKNAEGAVTLAGNNENFLGSIQVNAGTLRAGHANALGPAGGTTTIATGATLDVNGSNVGQGTEQVVVSGAGVGGNGAIVNTGVDVFPALNFVTLEGHTVFGGTGRWDLRSPGGTAGDPGTAALLTEGNPYNLTKVGPNFVGLVSLFVDAALADIDIQQGTLNVEGSITSLGEPSRTLTIRSNAVLTFFQVAGILEKNVVIQDGGNFNNASGENFFGGQITLEGGTATFNIGGTSMQLNGPVRDSGSLTKLGGSPLLLVANNTYTGNTRVNAGRLTLFDSTSIASSPSILLSGTGIIDVTMRSDGTLTLASGQTLGGSGAVDGSLTAGAGTTVAPGAAGTPVGTLSVSNSITLGGTTALDLDPARSTNDVLRATAITFGGALNLTVSSGSLTGGERFKLFDAGSYSGSFASIAPASPGPGLTWDTSTLATDGTLRVGGSAPAQPTIGQVDLTGGNLVFSGTGGSPGGTYRLLSSSDITLPIATWTAVQTNMFDANGNFNISTAVDPNTPHRFFVIAVP